MQSEYHGVDVLKTLKEDDDGLLACLAAVRADKVLFPSHPSWKVWSRLVILIPASYMRNDAEITRWSVVESAFRPVFFTLSSHSPRSKLTPGKPIPLKPGGGFCDARSNERNKNPRMRP